MFMYFNGGDGDGGDGDGGDDDDDDDDDDERGLATRMSMAF